MSAAVLVVASEHRTGGLETWDVSASARPRLLDRVSLPWVNAITLHPRLPVGYAVTSEHCRIATVALIEDGGIETRAEVATGPTLPCALTVDPSGSALVVVHYLAGRVTRHRLGSDGSVEDSESLPVPPGAGPDLDRQDRPYPHQARFVPGDGGDLWVSDLGADRLLRYPIGDGPPDVLALARGSGPRHFAWLGEHRVAVVEELSSRLSVYRIEAGALDLLGSAPLGAAVPGRTRNYPSDLAVRPDRALVYVANRGAGSISVVDVTAGPSVVQEITVGVWPQNLLLGTDGLWCAVRDDDRIVRLPFLERGLLGAPEHVVEVSRPSWIEWLSCGE
ncbi:hypothetical protein GCM10023350_39300 [Nocardioides endophyticus]|uniref:Lactonase family protein n=1 Tax=Nocardioides endophyticus TaxID=1353775 RepID=A0ABP8Z9H4_9ACTN